MKANFAILIFAGTLVLNGCSEGSDHRKLIQAQIDQTGPINLSPDIRKAMLVQLKEQREIWTKNKPLNYSYRWKRDCYCPDAYYNFNYENGAFVSMSYVGLDNGLYKNEDERDEDCASHYSVVAVFDLIEDILKEKSTCNTPRYPGTENLRKTTDIEYDTEFGFPTIVSYDTEGVIDEEFIITIEKLTPL